MRWWWVVVFACACGRLGFDASGIVADGDGGSEGDGSVAVDRDRPVGTWVATEMQVNGEPDFRLRSDLDNGIRADFVIFEDPQLRGVFRALRLQNELGQTGPDNAEPAILIEEEKWVLSGNGNVVVFDVSWQADDEFTLTLDAGDARNMGNALFTVGRFKLGAPRDLSLAGGYQLEQIQTATQSAAVNAGECVPDGPGGIRFTGTAELTPAFLGRLSLERRTYNMSDCSDAGSLNVSEQEGFLDDTTSPPLLWLPVARLDLDLDFSNGFRYRVEDCIPSGCEGMVFQFVSFAR